MKRPSTFTRLQSWWWPVCFLLVATTAVAAGDELPTLRPPRDELRPSFWEQHGWIIMLAAFALLGAVAFLIRWLQRPKPVVAIPPETTARQAFSALQDRPEDAALVGEVSRILRRYIYSAFNLPHEELTTTEFNQALQTHPQIGAELATAVGNFLRQSDERKFAAVASAVPPQPVLAGASELVEKLERQRQSALRATQPTP
ncbi:MAG: hypothetical protein JWR69_4110 [Pedosphaera sp.]|nr:hypothetical protein [Pedosphaera sp.]